MVSVIILYYNLMGPSSYMRFVVYRNVVMRRMTVCLRNRVCLRCIIVSTVHKGDNKGNSNNVPVSKAWVIYRCGL